MLIKKVVKIILIFRKLFWTIAVLATKSSYSIYFGNHGNRQNCVKVVFDTYNECGNKNSVFY